MRSIKLVSALAAGAALLALAPAASTAHKGLKHHPKQHASAATGCRLSLEAPKSVITFGESITLFGALTCPTQASAANQQVTIFQRALRSGVHAATIVGSATTEAGGAYQFTSTPSSNTLYFASVTGARSAHKTVKVSPAVTLAGPSGTQLFTGAGAVVGVKHVHNRLLNQYTFKGTVNPFEAGEVVALQREASTATEEWRRIDLGTVNNKGEFAIHHIFASPGDANLRVVVRPRHSNAPGASEPLAYVISQPQNPALEIHASADPISFGQQVAIEGVVKGAVNQPITLLERNAGGSFAPVFSGMTDALGNYKIMRSPTKNTAYRVTSGTTKSSVLFEGVKYVLTPMPTAPSVQAGQLLTLSGSVSPVHAGHPIYLERQNGAGIGFHVVEVGTVSSTGTYSISHAFFGPGTAKLRVQIPGDPENQGVATPLVEVTITPAPSGTFKPFAPSKLPGDGQF